MDTSSTLTLRGRRFSEQEIEIMRTCIRENYDKGRTYISRRICEALEWRQPNGWLKDRACRDVLRKLEELHLVDLPPSKKIDRKSPSKPENSYRILEEIDLTSPVTDFPEHIRFIQAKGNRQERLWNALVNKYHYLGHSVLVGRSLKYLIEADSRIVGAISFSSPAWSIQCRDKILRSLEISPNLMHDVVINNTRFLILPNVRIPNFASAALSLATKVAVSDWKSYYSVTPLIVETFVQPSLYQGTCYKAANWVEIGITTGYAKHGSSHHNSQEPKLVFIYGLDKRTRRKVLKTVKTK